MEELHSNPVIKLMKNIKHYFLGVLILVCGATTSSCAFMLQPPTHAVEGRYKLLAENKIGEMIYEGYLIFPKKQHYFERGMYKTLFGRMVSVNSNSEFEVFYRSNRGLTINMHPGIQDHNVLLHGVVSADKSAIDGQWSFSSQGADTLGKFHLRKTISQNYDKDD